MARWIAAILFCSIVPAAPAAPDKADPGYQAANALITSYYRSILGRDPEPAGQAFWEREVARMGLVGADLGEVLRAMAIAFFDSPEYQGANPALDEYVTDLYATFFGRAPDPGGLAYWKSEIDKGLPRQVALLSFLFSSEFEGLTRDLFGAPRARASANLVVDFYRGFFNRLPDTGGMAYWQERFRQAQCSGAGAVAAEVESISSQFVSGDEYQARGRSNTEYVSDLYNAFLRRGGEREGVAYWVRSLDTGLRREDMRGAFRESEEFKSRVAAVVAEGCFTLSQASNLYAGNATAGVTPFLALLDIHGLGLERIQALRFTIQPKAGALSRPLQAKYSRAYLQRQGFGLSFAGALQLPLFGLYSGHSNQVMVEAFFDDGSSALVPAAIQTEAYLDPTNIYNRPNILQPRAPGASLSFDYIYLKSAFGFPVVIDTDGEVRWAMPGTDALSSAFYKNAFIVGDPDSLTLKRVELHGGVRETVLQGPYTNFHHNIDPGKVGLLGEVDAIKSGYENLENILVEFDDSGAVLREWDFGRIIAEHMQSKGDNPDLFVRLGADWFHMNAATYNPRDDTIIASGREQFLIAVDYSTGKIRWILGDPTKYWYSFPSLRSLSLRLADGGLYPAGQHAVSVTADGTVMVFNNGLGSSNQPEGAARGETRTYSAVSGYAIDTIAGAAREVMRFDYGRTINSRICSSAYQPGAGRSMLVNYAFVNNGTLARVVGLDDSGAVAFDFEYLNRGCSTSWNSMPVPFHDLVFE